MDTPPRRHVVIAFPLGAEAVAVVADRLGAGFAVRDIRAEGPAADLVVSPPCSPQAIGHLKRAFPNAALVVVEIEDLLRGVDLGGPVSRSLAAGADAYYVAGSSEALGDFLARMPVRADGPEPDDALSGSAAFALAAAVPADDLVSRVRRRVRPEPARPPGRGPGP